jgi:hypothetical protein
MSGGAALLLQAGWIASVATIVAADYYNNQAALLPVVYSGATGGVCRDASPMLPSSAAHATSSGRWCYNRCYQLPAVATGATFDARRCYQQRPPMHWLVLPELQASGCDATSARRRSCLRAAAMLQAPATGAACERR